MNKLMRIEWVSEWVIECHSSASKSPWHDYVIHELKTTLRNKEKRSSNGTVTYKFLYLPNNCFLCQMTAVRKRLCLSLDFLGPRMTKHLRGCVLERSTSSRWVSVNFLQIIDDISFQQLAQSILRRNFPSKYKPSQFWNANFPPYISLFQCKPLTTQTFSFSTLRYCLLGFNSRKFPPHLTSKMKVKKIAEVWNSAILIFATVNTRQRDVFGLFMLLPWQRDVTTSPLYIKVFDTVFRWPCRYFWIALKVIYTSRGIGQIFWNM